MSVKKYKFVSPGVFVSEIDNSQLPEQPADIGPVVIGRSQRGPGMKPVTVESFADFINTFGNPTPQINTGDAWRNGPITGPTYAVYAAQAWLRNNSPLTFVRLLGEEDPQKETAGAAGWFTRDTDGDFNGNAVDGGGAYGLFILPSSSVSDAQVDDSGDPILKGRTQMTGGLAAIWYCNEGYITLTGSLAGAGAAGAGTSSCGVLVSSESGKKAFTAEIFNSANASQGKVNFSLTRTDDNYIRNVFNTSPPQTNNRITSDYSNIFLGESFEKHIDQSVRIVSGAFAVDGQPNGVVSRPTDYWGVIMPLKLSGSSIEQGDFRKQAQAAQTGWFFSQDIVPRPGEIPNALTPVSGNAYQAQNMPKLFRLKALSKGEWASKNLKVSIANIKQSFNSNYPYGTFSIQLRRLDDNDSAVQIVEQFDNLSLDPDSANYISRKIGDRYQTWDNTNKRYIEYGDYANQSKFVYVEVDPGVANKTTDGERLPFGVYGPPTWKSIQFRSGALAQTLDNLSGELTTAAVYSTAVTNVAFPDAGGRGTMGGEPIYASGPGAAETFISLNDVDPVMDWSVGSTKLNALTGTLEFPRTYVRVSSSTGNSNSPSAVYWGFDSSLGATSPSIFAKSTLDVVLPKPAGQDDFTVAEDGPTQYSWIFTLDDITQRVSGAVGTGYTGDNITPNAIYVSGSRANGLSVTSISSSWQKLLDLGFNSFTSPLFGGTDGLDIYEKEPFNNTDALSTSATEANSYAYYSTKKAIDSITDPEVVEYNLASLPGITNTKLTNYLVETCESRGDALAVVDLQDVYVPAVDYGVGGAQRGNVNTCITTLKNRQLDSSYACAYYPWVQIQDTINDITLWAPPSIAALGTFSSSESDSKLWFAPAGFNRGGLTEGSAGIPVVGVRDKLTSKQRDKLYEVNINPIASFPAEGIVIFGQKTLQATPSALDRINVRRLMIFVKKQISRIANNILFEQNVQATWDGFLAAVNPFLSSIQSDFGLTDFKVVLDETTTTPELIDRNILYAKIFLKPARAIEYIAIDFNITNTGASFED
tara:strand:+ start:5289 stop:8414 length:3126 start_codon:yes stop_codon:yes gene_type:complete